MLVRIQVQLNSTHLPCLMLNCVKILGQAIISHHTSAVYPKILKEIQLAERKIILVTSNFCP